MVGVRVCVIVGLELGVTGAVTVVVIDTLVVPVVVHEGVFDDVPVLVLEPVVVCVRLPVDE